jgi:hypothetical protein
MSDIFQLDCTACGRCLGCNNCTAEPGCYVDQLCPTCTPLNGRCLDCRDVRAEDQADWMTRYAIENEVCS